MRKPQHRSHLPFLRWLYNSRRILQREYRTQTFHCFRSSLQMDCRSLMRSKWLYLLVVSLLALPVAAQNQPTSIGHPAGRRNQPGDAARHSPSSGTIRHRPRTGRRFLSHGTNASSVEPSAGSAGRAPAIPAGRPYTRGGKLSRVAHAGAVWPAVRPFRCRHRIRFRMACFSWPT